ncbi:hypothetical protein GPECTOR_33g555 [Gonium pectorale]|uniref:C-type lectin domain-containing protein n=1 Tax=Gonium pectorale TaxID=33097 RepID=A0A150GD16_GONPE|nr:hypothetical protein GPECTOR_33g555 [Gonium pectorale]|eukprot:KXZ47673.1 hypothetical protein GPECTOR_33g555 [Gonium pectorale]
MADQACGYVGARLVTINDADENRLLVEALTAVVVNNATFPPTDLDPFGNVRIWIGLRFQTAMDDSFWNDGTRVDQGYNPSGAILPLYPNSCYAIWCRRDYCGWQPQPCTNSLPGLICEVRGVFV